MPKQKYTLIKALKRRVNHLCSIAHVSPSGYYKWLQQDTYDRDEDAYEVIKVVFEQGKQKLGWRRIKMHLAAEQQITMNHKKIKRIMKKYALQTKVRKSHPYKTMMRKSQEHRTFPNILKRNFIQTTPMTTLCTDITYLYYARGRRAYLSVIKDIATKEIVSWELSQNITMTFVLNSIKKLQTLTRNKETMLHSDQGVHYTHPEYILELQALGITQSMSRKGNCLDNAPIESFFGHLKDEVEYQKATSYAELFQYIHTYMNYYNNERYQWNLKKMTPAQYRRHLFSSLT